MENHSIHDLKQRPFVSCIIDTLGIAPVWARTEGLTRGAILSGLKDEVESSDGGPTADDAAPPVFRGR